MRRVELGYSASITRRTRLLANRGKGVAPARLPNHPWNPSARKSWRKCQLRSYARRGCEEEMAKYNATAQGLQCKGSQRLSQHGVILTRAQQKALGTVEYQQQRGNNFGWPHWHNWGGHRSGINCIVMIFDLVEVRPTKQRERS